MYQQQQPYNYKSSFQLAAKQSLSSSNYRLIQDISDQNGYNLIAEQITTYLDQNGNQVDSFENFKVQKQQNQRQYNYGSYQQQHKFFENENQESKVKVIQKSKIKNEQKNYTLSSKYNKSDISQNNSNVGYKASSKISPNNSRLKRSKYQQPYEMDMDLSNVQSIIDEINIFMQKKKLGIPYKQQKQSQEHQFLDIRKQKNNKITNKFKKKWNANFNMMNKLDQMLLSYNTQEENQVEYNNKEKSQIEQSVMYQNDNQFNEDMEINKIAQQFDKIILINYNKLPLLPNRYDNILLKFQSYPSQPTYQPLLIKVLQNKISHYNILTYPSAGINQQNQKLLSEQQFVSKWQQCLDIRSKQILTQQQCQLLMQFDTEWYRTVIDYAYGQGLQQLLQKDNYDISKYVDLIQLIFINSQQQIAKEVIENNRKQYLKDYISQIKFRGNRTSVIAILFEYAIDDFNDTNFKQSYLNTQTNILLILLSQPSNDKNPKKHQYKLQDDNKITLNKILEIRISSQEQQKSDQFANTILITKDQQTINLRMIQNEIDQNKVQCKLKEQTQFGKIYGVEFKT